MDMLSPLAARKPPRSRPPCRTRSGSRSPSYSCSMPTAPVLRSRKPPPHEARPTGERPIEVKFVHSPRHRGQFCSVLAREGGAYIRGIERRVSSVRAIDVKANDVNAAYVRPPYLARPAAVATTSTV